MNTAASDDRFLEFSRLAKAFATARGATAVVVEDFDLRVAEGEFVCLIGHSGCGKSTVLSIAMGLMPPSSGGVILGGREVDGPGPRPRRRLPVAGSPAVADGTPERARSPSIRRGPTRRAASAGASPTRRWRASVSPTPPTAGPRELSAGMQQRVGIARAFALEPRVLLLDEPFSLLDAFTRMDLQDELLRLWEEDRRTVVMVTHDVDEALLLADRIVMMTNGPRARVGDSLEIPFERPRHRGRVLEQPQYYELRERLLGFLAEQERSREPDAHGGTVR